MTIPKGDASASSIQMWRQCRLRWKKTRRDGRGREHVETDPMLVGKLYHEVCELAYQRATATQPIDRIVDATTLLEILDYVVTVREQRAAEKAEEERAKANASKPIKIRRGRPKKAISDDVRESAEELLAGTAPLDLTMTGAVEIPWSLRIGSGETAAEVVGVFDRVDEVVNRETGEIVGIEIVDYKTGGHVIEDHLLANNVQVQLYILAARERFHDAKKLQLRFYWAARDQWSVPIVWTKAFEEKARRQIEDDLAAMKAVGRRLEGEEALSPTIGSHCDDCPFKFECTAYRGELVRAQDTAVLDKARTIEPSDLATPILLKARQRLKVAEDLVAGLRKAYDAEIRERIPDGEYSVVAADLVAQLKSRGSYAPMPEDDVVEFLMPILAREPSGEPVNPDAEVPLTEREAFLLSISSIDKKKLAAAISKLGKDERKRVNKVMKERREKTGEATWVEVNDVEKPF